MKLNLDFIPKKARPWAIGAAFIVLAITITVINRSCTKEEIEVPAVGMLFGIESAHAGGVLIAFVSKLQTGHAGSYAFINGDTKNGALIEVLPAANIAVMYWFTYKPDQPGEPMWLVGVSDPLPCRGCPDDKGVLDGVSPLPVTFPELREWSPTGTFFGIFEQPTGPVVGAAEVLWHGNRCNNATISYALELTGAEAPLVAEDIPMPRITEVWGSCVGCQQDFSPGEPGPHCPEGFRPVDLPLDV